MTSDPARLLDVVSGFVRPERHWHGAPRSALAPLGAVPHDDGSTRFRVWAPAARRVDVVLDPVDGSGPRTAPLDRQDDGYHEGHRDDVPPGTRYLYRLDGGAARPDPASRWQPDGVDGPSAVVDPTFDWHDHDWHGIAMGDVTLLEVHVGTATPEGTLDALQRHLPAMAEHGITTVELMPVAQFPGRANWGYDGVLPFAVQDTYGGPDALRRFVDAAHGLGLAVALDVVYNHLGPEGSIVHDFGPYFTDHYRTPWGAAINLDQHDSDAVRAWFVQNALHWVHEHHIDMLRLDAVHAIIDKTATPFLQELTEAVHACGADAGREVLVVAESDDNDPRLVRPPAQGGMGMDGVWSDEFHHALHALLTGERTGYYQDFGTVAALAKAHRDGFVHTGQYAAFRGRRHGAPSSDLPSKRFVVFAQNHDQVGNRADGARIDSLLRPALARQATATVLLSPFRPLMFMGEPWSDPAPFHYFVDHRGRDLRKAVREGRARDLRHFGWRAEPLDPNDPDTFAISRPDNDGWTHPERAPARHLHEDLLDLRRATPAIDQGRRDRLTTEVRERPATLAVWHEAEDPQPTGHRALVVHHYGDAAIHLPLTPPAGTWQRAFDSNDARYGGPGTGTPPMLTSDGRSAVTLELVPHTSALYVRQAEGVPHGHDDREVTQ